MLALDDYHVVDTPAVHDAVSLLIDNLPAQVTLAIRTRADPPLTGNHRFVLDYLLEEVLHSQPDDVRTVVRQGRRVPAYHAVVQTSSR